VIRAGVEAIAAMPGEALPPETHDTRARPLHRSTWSPIMTGRMRLLFVKGRLGWPRTYGHDVHCYEMMRGLTALGHDVALATHHAPAPEALDGLSLGHVWVLDDSPGTAPVALSYLQERYRSYWGISHGRIADLARRTAEWNA